MSTILTKLENGIVENTTTADTSLDEIVTFIGKHVQEWEHLQVVWIMHHFDFNSISSDEIHYLLSKVTALSHHRSGRKTALVANSDIGFGMLRMLALLADGRLAFTIKVYRTVTEAKNWLLSSL